MSKKAKQEKDAAAEGAVQTAEQISQAEAEANAAFSAGFHEGETPVAEPAPKAKGEEQEQQEQPTQQQTQQQSETEQQEQAGASASEEAGDEPVMLAGMKESEIKALLAMIPELRDHRIRTDKELQKVFGKFGEIQRQISTGSQGAMTKREVNAEALTRLKAEYPEIATLLAGDLSEVLSSVPVAGQGGLNQEQVDTHVRSVVKEQVDAAVEALNERFLSRFHSDWEDIAKSDDLTLWLQTHPEEYRTQFLASRDAVFLATGLDKFKAWREQGQAQRQRNQNRLERAITPKGGAPAGPATLNDQDAFRKGFESG